MKNIWLFPIIFLTFFDLSPTPPIPNPASAYVAFLGYKSVIRKDLKGEYGVCIFPDGSECEEWAFFRGTCGKEYSYCSKKGCETYSITENKGSYTVIYCACCCVDSSGNKKVTPLEEFMKQHGDTLIKAKPGRIGNVYKNN